MDASKCWMYAAVVAVQSLPAGEAPFTRLAIFVVPYAYFTYDEANVRNDETFDNQRHLS